MKKLLLVLGFLGLLFGFSGFAKADQLPAPSLWKNQHGSVLRVTSVNGTSFRGTFTSFDPSFQCRGIPYPVTGYTLGPQTSFTVNFVKCQTVTKWAGNTLGFGMSVQWVLQHNGQTQVGFDFFSRN
jgi:hypothetical protein